MSTKLPTRDKAFKLLSEHVLDDYQKLHAKMVALCLEEYADKYEEDKDLWYITGLLHDLDYYKHPDNHPNESIKWFEDWDFPEELIHAIEAHNWKRSGIEPKTKLAKALCATDELTGFLYAYSLMRPSGFEGMKASSVKKKFKDKSFAAKIDRNDITYGVEKLGVDFTEHVNLVIDVLQSMSELNKKRT